MADSAEGAGTAKPQDDEAPVLNVLDGDKGTFWHSSYTGEASPLPHDITLVMGSAVNMVSGLKVHMCIFRN